MAKRKSLSNRTRFEVFKRDEFVCQYCGRKPPQVILQVDHIIPVSKGGDNEIINLVTSCFDCNSGKSNIEVNDKITRNDIRLINEQNKEKQDQLDEYYKFLAMKYKNINDEVEEISFHWTKLSNDKYKLNELGKASIRKFLSYLDKYQIMDSLDLSTIISANDIEYRFRYFCGICWNKIKGVKNESK